ncbi:MAG TPA: cytochrome P450, partial [Chloroflexia bacterium]|nr:cytochrome P450 [Chloroflexia bacterium]
MSKTLAEMPFVDVRPFDSAYWHGGLGSIMAGAAVEHGPVFRWEATDPYEQGQTRVSMVGPEANRFVMHTHRHAFSHDLGWSPFISDTFGKGLLNMDDPEHAVHRKMWNPAFAGAVMGAYLPVMQRVIEERTAEWLTRGEVDLYAEARTITFDIAAAALAGFEPSPQVDYMRRLFQGLLMGPSGAQDEEAFMASFTSTRNELVGRLLMMIAARRAAPPEERPRDVLGLIVHARDDRGQPLSDEQVLGHLAILLVAGHETTTTLGSWALYLLATMPEHQTRLLEEIEGAPRDENGAIAFEALRSMKALDNFVRETGRMYSPVLNVPRGVTEDVEFGGYVIPAGTQVRLGLAASHMLPSVFKDPERFDPGRFAAPRDEDKATPYALVTFGGGPRVCIGMHFAHIE